MTFNSVNPSASKPHLALVDALTDGNEAMYMAIASNNRHELTGLLLKAAMHSNLIRVVQFMIKHDAPSSTPLHYETYASRELVEILPIPEYREMAKLVVQSSIVLWPTRHPFWVDIEGLQFRVDTVISDTIIRRDSEMTDLLLKSKWVRRCLDNAEDANIDWQNVVNSAFVVHDLVLAERILQLVTQAAKSVHWHMDEWYYSHTILTVFSIGGVGAIRLLKKYGIAIAQEQLRDMAFGLSNVDMLMEMDHPHIGNVWDLLICPPKFVGEVIKALPQEFTWEKLVHGFSSAGRLSYNWQTAENMEKYAAELHITEEHIRELVARRADSAATVLMHAPKQSDALVMEIVTATLMLPWVLSFSLLIATDRVDVVRLEQQIRAAFSKSALNASELEYALSGALNSARDSQPTKKRKQLDIDGHLHYNADAEPRRFCYVCGEPAKYDCSRCHAAYYCGTEHQKQHWNSHRLICKQ
jgi:energy-converting hydrogenase A subunit M